MTAKLLCACAPALVSACGDASGPPVHCLDPAPLEGSADPRAPGYIVLYRDGTDAAAETVRLAERHDFAPRHIYATGTTGFSAELSPAALAGVRCEGSVATVSHNALVVVADE